MDDEETRVSVCRSPACRTDEIRELRADIMSLGRETGGRDPDATHGCRERSRSVEDVDAGVLRETHLRNAAALVIAGDDEDGYTAVGDPREWVERLPREARRDP